MARMRPQRLEAEDSKALMQSQLADLATKRVEAETSAVKRMQAKFEQRAAHVCEHADTRALNLLHTHVYAKPCAHTHVLA